MDPANFKVLLSIVMLKQKSVYMCGSPLAGLRLMNILYGQQWDVLFQHILAATRCLLRI